MSDYLVEKKPDMDRTKQCAREPALAVIREIVRAYQAFGDFSIRDIKRFGLTGPEFDVLATLGNQPGMTFKEIGENTLITKTTLTGVVDRLEQKGLVERRSCPEDRRCIRAVLTEKGDQLFRDVFPDHVERLKERLDALTPEEREHIVGSLTKVRRLLLD
ncbi:MAG TPA: MarR family transcriptional regulator [Gammaproteobacteria bacterium]